MEARFETFQLVGVFLIGVLQMSESARGIDVITRIDANFLYNGSGHVGHVRVEVNIGHEGCGVAQAREFGFDVAQILGFTRALRSETDIVTACIHDGLYLAHTSLGIGGCRRGHALEADRVVASQWLIAHAHLMRIARRIVE